MMKKYFILNTVSLILLLFSACKEGEQLEPVSSQVVKVEFTGSTSKELEFIYKDNVVASQGEGTGFASKVLLDVSGQDLEITVREKGSTAILTTWNVDPATFSQTFSIFYDGTAAYDGVVRFKVKGFAMEGELEFLLDGNPQAEGSAKIDQILPIYINKTEPRQLQVRKKGETTILLSKTVGAEPVDGQSLTFFFDGTNIVDNVELNPPANPANMSITGQFSSTFKIASSGAVFKGGEVDLVFYIRNTAGIVTIPNPAIRIIMPSNGDFKTFELPPLPDNDSFYTYDICEVGTDALPYTNFGLAATYPPKINQGRFGGEIKFGNRYFEAGVSKLLLMQDAGTIKTSPAAIRGRYFFGKITDLSQYF